MLYLLIVVLIDRMRLSRWVGSESPTVNPLSEEEKRQLEEFKTLAALPAVALNNVPPPPPLNDWEQQLQNALPGQQYAFQLIRNILHRALKQMARINDWRVLR